MKAVIVEDESYSLDRLIKLLSSFQEIEIVGTAGDGETAIEIINRRKPDVIFLDIELPVFNGFEVVRRLNYNPKVVFITAYDRYAIKAFEINSVDYILKPVEPDRLKNTIQRLKEEKTGINGSVIESLLKSIKSRGYLKHFSIKKGDEIIILPEEEVYYFKAEDKYVFLCSYNGEYFYDATLKELEEKLDPEKFIRIHRSYIVSLDKILKIKKWFLGEYRVELKDKENTTLKISRSYLPEIKKKLHF